MITAVNLNGQKLNHKDGLIYVDNLNETLDNSIIVCEGVERLTIEPMDEIDLILSPQLTKRMLVSSYVEEIASYKPKRYNYQIQVVSPILLLERIPLPNIAITTIYKEENDELFLVENGDYYSRSILYYVRQYCSEYLKSVKWELSDFFYRKASEVICPEMMFNRPTLKEVLQALVQPLDMILTLNYDYDNSQYIIDVLNPNLIGNEIDINKLNTDTITNSVNHYASSLDVELVNAINDKVTKSIPFISFRTDEAILTTDNAKIILNSPIYSIDKVELNFDLNNFYGYSDGKLSNLGWVDITKYVVEKSVYDALEIGNPVEDSTPNDLKKFNTVWFKQGSNTIEGWGNRNSILGGLGDSYAVLYYITKDIIVKNYPEYENYLHFVWMTYLESFLKYIFRITYTAQQDVKLQTEKIKSLNHKSTLIDNQDNQYVNVELFAKNSLSTLNRLGNNERTITAIYDNFNEIPVLGDYIEDYILTTREISIYDNYCVFKGTLTKDFADKYQFNAINSKKRFYNISDEKIVRHEIKKRYLIYSYENNNKENDEYNNYTEQARLLLHGSKLVPEYIILKTFKNAEYGLGREIVLECNSYFAGNAVLTTFGFDDNVVAGNVTGSKITGGYLQAPLTYCDKYGENFSYEVFAFDSYNYSVHFSSAVEYEEFWSKYSRYLPLSSRVWESETPYEYPFKPLNSCKYKIDFNHHKDQREVLKWTIQNVIVSDNDNIVLGEVLYEELVQNKVDLLNMQLVRLNTGRFTARNNNSITDYSIIEKFADNAVEIEWNSLKINASGNIALIYKDRLYLGLNNYVANTPIYLNIRDER